jgi:hypothetical protein
MEMNITTEHGSCVIHPIQFIEQEQEVPLPVPLIRVTCCGMMMLEVLKEVVSTDPPLGRYEVISTQVLRGRGAVPSMMLLELLGSQPHRFATKDWLITQLQQEMESGALVRLDTVASQLRKQFRGFQGEDANALGLVLVAYLRNGRGSGPGYQLAPYPLIWLDTDALAWNVEQAARMERFGQDALPWWERAYALASHGEYLPDEPYSEWAANKRAEVEGALRQCVHALHHLYLAHHGAAGAEEAMRLLRSYWLSHKTDEDALRPLMELLGEQECYNEAEEDYQQFLLALAELRPTKNGHPREPDPRTQDIREYLRIKQIQRQRVESPTTSMIEEAKPTGCATSWLIGSGGALPRWTTCSIACGCSVPKR